jgi:hypothetical protein
MGNAASILRTTRKKIRCAAEDNEKKDESAEELTPLAHIELLEGLHQTCALARSRWIEQQIRSDQKGIFVIPIFGKKRILDDLELDVSFKPSRIWTQQSRGFEKAVWDCKGPGFGAKIYRSATLTHAISKVQQIMVILLPLIKYCHLKATFSN